MSILKTPAARPVLSSFQATTERALFILRLARKLGDPDAASHYADLARDHNNETLLVAYRRTMKCGHPPKDLGRRFHEVLARVPEQRLGSGRNGSGDMGPFLSVKVERRSIAVAVFVGTKLDYHDIRHLRAEPDKADASALNFIAWVLGEYDITSAALERMTNGDDVRRAGVNRAVLGALRQSMIPVWEISKRELLEAYAYPPLRNRAELRQVTQNILWSMFNTNAPGPQEIDAATLGLFVQTERMFLV